MNEKVKALLDAIAEWEKVDDLVKQYGWGKWVDDDNEDKLFLPGILGNDPRRDASLPIDYSQTI